MRVTDIETTEDDHPRSATAAVRGFVKKHQKVIAGAVTVVTVITAGLLLHAGGQHDDDDEEFDAPSPGSDPESEPDGQQGQPRSAHPVKGHLMRISGRPSERARANYADAYAAGLVESEEIPPGHTWRDDCERGYDAA
ncbi:hypothetical protein OG455_27270 [Kitasatospora sp. NBC_01287]|uniref:hypothetical protein n=1 Tax=Kitasatospora sp. NBC_01287 TaxID=2903573 RepID=UPI0022566E3A|nr:hypothetical protein [Kitasatospora sp. NBC_01287]MCX4749164.1 hypothetical protein [Kitasatospora sp. NBC_01287]